MQLDLEEYLVLENKVLNTIKLDLMDFNREGELDTYLQHINMYDRIFEGKFIETKNVLYRKIAVIGQSDIKENHLLGIGKDLGFDKNQFEFCLEYEDIEKYNFNKLKNEEYSFIFVGPMPHKLKGGNGYSSMIERLKDEEGFPKLLELRNDHEYKITKTNFRLMLEDILYEYK